MTIGTMLDVFGGVKSVFKIRRTHIDSTIFRLHYRVTTSALIACCLMLAAKQFVGNPIECVHGKDIPAEVIDTWCWIHSTYTVQAAFTRKVGVDVPYPGVDNTRGGNPADRRVYRFY
ncbi:hypothetical protein LSTR_LSTR017582, partial [Laodelphax striatellus]